MVTASDHEGKEGWETRGEGITVLVVTGSPALSTQVSSEAQPLQQSVLGSFPDTEQGPMIMQPYTCPSTTLLPSVAHRSPFQVKLQLIRRTIHHPHCTQGQKD